MNFNKNELRKNKGYGCIDSKINIDYFIKQYQEQSSYFKPFRKYAHTILLH